MVTHPNSGKNPATLDYLRIDSGEPCFGEGIGAVVHPNDHAHRDEQRLHHYLSTHPDYEFSDLVVHRCPEGVCVEGRLHARPGAPDLATEIFRVLGRCKVINHVVLCTECAEEQGEDPYEECGCGD